MCKTKIYLVTLIVLATALTGYFAISALQKNLNQQTQKLFHSFGFTDISLPAPRIQFNQALYSGVSLDKEDFSTIEYILITFNPAALVLSKEINNIQIIGLNLTGELSNNAELTIAGWHKEKFNPATTFKKPAVLEIKKGSLSLFTPQFGGVSIAVNLQARTKNKNIELQGTLKSQQKYIGFDAKLSGYITPQNIVQSTFEIESAKFELPHIKASRINGDVKLSLAPNQNIEILSKIEAGGLSLYGSPWRNASATFEKSNNISQTFLGAKSLGENGLDLSLEIQPSGALTGLLFAPNINSFLEYLEIQNFIPSEKEALEKLSGLKNLEIKFTRENSEQKNITYRIKDSRKDIDIKGEIKIRN